MSRLFPPSSPAFLAGCVRARLPIAFVLAPIIALAITLSAASPALARALKDGLYPPGRLVIAGRRLRCGKVKTLVSSKYWRAGGSIPGLIGLNPRKLRAYSRVEQWFIYTHECSHQYVGKSERKADCRAARVGKRQGWLTRKGLKRICRTIRNDPARYGYPSGRRRCQIMRRCYRRAR